MKIWFYQRIQLRSNYHREILGKLTFRENIRSDEGLTLQTSQGFRHHRENVLRKCNFAAFLDYATLL